MAKGEEGKQRVKKGKMTKEVSDDKETRILEKWERRMNGSRNQQEREGERRC